MYTDYRALGWFHCLEENTDAKGGMLLKLLYEIHARAKIVHLFRLALFGFSHALAVFLTLLLTVNACSLRQSICNHPMLHGTEACTVSLYQGR